MAYQHIYLKKIGDVFKVEVNPREKPLPMEEYVDYKSFSQHWMLETKYFGIYDKGDLEFIKNAVFNFHNSSHDNLTKNGIDISDFVEIKIFTCHDCFRNSGSYLSPDCCGEFIEKVIFKHYHEDSLREIWNCVNSSDSFVDFRERIKNRFTITKKE